MAALGDRHTLVVLAVDDQDWRLDARNERGWTLSVERMWTDPFVGVAAAHELLVCRDVAGRDHHAPVGDAGAHHTGLEAGRLADDPGRHEAALAPAAASEPVRIGKPLLDQQIDAGDDVEVVLVADRVADRLREGGTVAHPAARVR